ncbi:MetQ/NlpA family ABC transporter substrate-binding protein [Providencia heimbachae]|uniref:Substrate-binding component of an ABC superfamily methionine transporter n=1 Tax=Providencia heimbachae ATCC 35613 TaxID=1354272 RepID=A0A1B7JQ04_9GAMM|nr:MetQ/NlpA family ABC transporter substrate-binding protein [Providencia heimbachae]OAT49942.1 substrate-binding component of an ABC superfamily methionine transporter [Providencia heimbachae ATCC 35613]SQH12032.1 Lipoprotein 28 precursor [Providencia heimbachae]
MKKITALILALSISTLSACSQEENTTEKTANQTSSKQKIIVGSHGSDADIWKFIAGSQSAKDANLDIDVKIIDDGITLNVATIDGDVDVNAFQSWGFLKDFNKNHDNQLVAITTTYFEPMGVYSVKHKNLADLPNKAIVAIPNDAANHIRALKLLENAKLIVLKPDFNQATGSINDITNSPKELVFRQIKYAHGPRALPDVDIAVIGNTAAQEGGLNVLKDALFREQNDDSIKNNINILVVRADNKDDPKFAKLEKLYHSELVKKYIDDNFGGTKIQITKNISELN